MEVYKVDDVEFLHKIFRAFRSYKGVGHWYRGQANVNWELLPKAGRREYFLQDNKDLYRFFDWEKQAIAYGYNSGSFIEGLAIAQHHGLATRLLDWTQNPLVATFFAVNSLDNVDGVVYIFEAPERYIDEKHLRTMATLQVCKNPLNGVYGYVPRALSPRVLNQKGMFTVHCPANKNIEIMNSRYDSTYKNLIKCIIPHTLKNKILDHLDDYGIDESMLFPDLDGLSRFKNWETFKISKKSHKKD